MNLTREQKHSIADQLTAGAAPESIDGYDAAATAEWIRIETDRIAPYEPSPIVVVGDTLFTYHAGGTSFGPKRDQTIKPHWYAAGQITPVAPAKRKLTPGEEALRIGRSYGVNGQIWDNA